MRYKNDYTDELYFECEFGVDFSCNFDGDCFIISDGEYGYGCIETNEQLEELIDFLTEYKGKLNE